ncbi:unnamed protein product [Lactuca virosa]|uniref:Ubiquitin-like protease family profile domain-containing protein n=1 Tax=Lactuca virosa TaxID=75947 RepID=A0AAU9MA19_9ASTR|nr:unnamed protein product [Lactuca virosa]
MSKMTWDETDRGNYYCGPLLVLLLAYLEFMRNDKNEKRQIHALHFWDYEMIVKREKAELKSGDFGTLEWNDDVIENDEESDTDENEDMKLDRQFIFDKYIPFNERFDKFELNIKDAMKKDKELLTFEKVHLVFFPVHQKNHFYIICINLEEPAVDVIDNRNSVAKFPKAYRDAPNELKILFSRYLMRVNHKSASTLEGVELERVNMNWRTRDNHVDCGVFCMRHMETYMGDKTVNWTCGLPKESKQQQSVLNELRIKYLTKILLSDTNTYRSKIIAQTAKFAKKTNEEIKDLLDKGWEKRGERI